MIVSLHVRTRYAIAFYLVTFGSIIVAAYKMGMVHEKPRTLPPTSPCAAAWKAALQIWKAATLSKSVHRSHFKKPTIATEPIAPFIRF